MKTKKFVYDNYISNLQCSFCFEPISFNMTCYETSVFIRRARKKDSPANKTVVKHYHEDCHDRLNSVVTRRAGRVKNPVGRYGAKNGG